MKNLTDNIGYCSPEEEKEIIETLSRLTDDDLKIVKKETVNIDDYIRD
ncbi:hypothetical protein [Cetobacterium sp.]